MTFESWKSDFLSRAAAYGVSPAILTEVSPYLTTAQNSTQADIRLPEARKTLHSYIELTVSPSRIAQGQAALQKHVEVVDQIEAGYQVERHVDAAIWG